MGGGGVHFCFEMLVIKNVSFVKYTYITKQYCKPFESIKTFFILKLCKLGNDICILTVIFKLNFAIKSTVMVTCTI